MSKEFLFFQKQYLFPLYVHTLSSTLFQYISLLFSILFLIPYFVVWSTSCFLSMKNWRVWEEQQHQTQTWLTSSLKSLSSRWLSMRLKTCCCGGALAMDRSFEAMGPSLGRPDRLMVNTLMLNCLASAPAAMALGLRGWSIPSVINSTTLRLLEDVSWLNTWVALVMA